MQYECKITVLETKVFPELQEKYLADPKSGPCPCFKAGDTFVLKRTPEQDDFYHLMDGLNALTYRRHRKRKSGCQSRISIMAQIRHIRDRRELKWKN